MERVGRVITNTVIALLLAMVLVFYIIPKVMRNWDEDCWRMSTIKARMEGKPYPDFDTWLKQQKGE